MLSKSVIISDVLDFTWLSHVIAHICRRCILCIIRAVDCQASDDPIRESGLTIHSSNHKPFNLY